jgi:hypothetical protein
MEKRPPTLLERSGEVLRLTSIIVKLSANREAGALCVGALSYRTFRDHVN